MSFIQKCIPYFCSNLLKSTCSSTQDVRVIAHGGHWIKAPAQSRTNLNVSSGYKPCPAVF